MKLLLAGLLLGISPSAFACGVRCVPVTPGMGSPGGSLTSTWTPLTSLKLPTCPSRLSRLLTPKAVAVAAYMDANDKYQRTKAFLKLVEARFAAGLATANEVAEADYARHEAETAANAVRERAVQFGGLRKTPEGNFMCETLPGTDFQD